MTKYKQQLYNKNNCRRLTQLAVIIALLYLISTFPAENRHLRTKSHSLPSNLWQIKSHPAYLTRTWVQFHQDSLLSCFLCRRICQRSLAPLRLKVCTIWCQDTKWSRVVVIRSNLWVIIRIIFCLPLLSRLGSGVKLNRFA